MGSHSGRGRVFGLSAAPSLNAALRAAAPASAGAASGAWVPLLKDAGSEPDQQAVSGETDNILALSSNNSSEPAVRSARALAASASLPPRTER